MDPSLLDTLFNVNDPNLTAEERAQMQMERDMYEQVMMQEEALKGEIMHHFKKKKDQSHTIVQTY